MMPQEKEDPRFKTSHDVYMFANMYLQELGEIFWFRGENEITKGNKARAEFYTNKYHELHDVMREIDKLNYQKR